MQTPGRFQKSATATPPKSGGRDRGPIVLVGASARAAAESAQIAGFSPIVIDQFGDRETVASAHQWHSLDEIRVSDTTAMLDRIVGDTPIAIVGGLQGGYQWLAPSGLAPSGLAPSGLAPSGLARSGLAPSGRRFLGASPAQFTNCDDVVFLRELAARAAVRFPESRRNGGTKPGWLVKHRASSGGLGVSYCESGGPIPDGAILQQPVRGPICGASFFGLGDRALLLGVCRLLKKRIGPYPFVFAGALGPIPISIEVCNSLRRLGTAFCSAAPIFGPFNIDVAIQHDSVTLLEVNPRWSASMELVERAWSEASDEPCSMFDRPADWERRVGQSSQDPGESFCVGKTTFLKRVLFARADRTISPADFDRQTRSGRWEWKDVPRRPTQLNRHEPLATLITRLDRMSLRSAFRVIV
ncbi:ATP-grasp domain protein [Stieleria maiorica]|uniref:ATP-grasp domain protein n=1 Tax=Stieleria maiorica TaxID=2795974 RepID=A0A5B9MIT7_9BACT|nr:ATP-grasp domain-containing protein [Stieleria maiorica]QEG01119.1 ATP-grasp domain protein [Stieleria maiorica]